MTRVNYQTGKTKAEETSKSHTTRGRLTERDIIRTYIAPLTNLQPIELDCEDDAAVLEFPAGKLLVMTTDAIVEGTHFLSSDTPESLAKKALRVNLSDLAAMGAHPIGYTLCLTMGSSITEDWLKRFFASLGEDNQNYRVSLLGGDINESEGPLNISVTAIGDVAEGGAITRSGAHSGDRIYVTGTIGDATLGLKVLQGEYGDLSDADKAFLIRRFCVPTPRHVLAQNLGNVVHAATDISDGFLLDLDLICQASGLEAYVRVDRIPFSKAVKKMLKDTTPDDRTAFYQMLLSGGDDYELIFAASPGEADHIEYLAQRYSVPITCIGHLGLKAEEGSAPAINRINLIDEHGDQMPITELGYEHSW